MSYYLPLPSFIEDDGRSVKSWDLYTRLLKDRIIFIGSQIDSFVANGVIAQLLILQSEDPKKKIQLFINTPGGSVTDGMAIYDTINFLRCEVETYCVGMAASMGTVLLAAGTPGKRYALPNSRVMIHQPSGGATGQTSDISIAAREILRWKNRINEILSLHTDTPVAKLEADSDRDYFMTADEAKAYGIVDHVIEFNKEKLQAAKAESEGDEAAETAPKA